MRTQLLLTITLAGACADVASEVTPPTDFLVPSARPGELPGADFTNGVDVAPACLTRYDLTGGPTGVECHTAFVTGNPRHYITTCPAVFPLMSSHEVELDASDRVVRDVRVYPALTIPAAPGGQLVDTYRYNAQGLLIDIASESTLANIAGGNGTLVFGDRDSAGNPRTASRSSDPWIIDGVTYPGTAHVTWSFEYDAHNRLLRSVSHFMPSGNVYLDLGIAYNDGARVRNFSASSNLHAEVAYFPASSGPPLASYDLFDSDGQLIESRDTTRSRQLRYDEQGRRVTTVFHSDTYSYTSHEIYDCP